MKTLSNALIKFGVLLALGAQAQTEPITVKLSEKTVTLDVAIDHLNLKFSRAGYSLPVVKVLLPSLADVTILDHRNFREKAPCLASFDAQTPEEVIQDRVGVEAVDFTIKLNKILNPDSEKKTCIVTLEETVEGKIRGFKFEHQRYLSVGQRNINDCR
ncbi:MAG: hypothetical protein KA116_07255 [Proteobacteria bacterium]|nr:hypothetical protein [Pseudomonadota bacterium]